MKNRNILLSAFVLSITMVQAQHSDSASALDSMRMQFEDEVGLMISEFEHYADSARAEYERFEAQARAEYAQYVTAVQQVWGSDTLVDNTRTAWVEYGDEYTSRSIVDFEQGTIAVEVALDADEAADDALVHGKLADAVGQMLSNRGSANPYGGGTAVPVSETAILDGIVDCSRYTFSVGDSPSPAPKSARPTPPTPTVKGKELNIPTPQPRKNDTPSKPVQTDRKKAKGKFELMQQREAAREQAQRKAKDRADRLKVWVDKKKVTVDVSKVAEAVVEQSKQIRKTTKGTDGKQRTVVRVEMAMATDYLNEKAAEYKHLVSEFSQKFQIEEPLIYAVMEQESRFNPQAVSPKKAYGLMQLVPTSGGCDAYTYVKKLPKPKCPEPSYLYVPRNNIELGTAYLRILMNRFASVTDPDCRRLCVIAAYNTGEGNVSESFVGRLATAKSIAPHINALNYDQLYRHLTTRLSTSEARGYVEGVSRRREKYMK